MYAHGIGLHDEVFSAVAQADDAKLLLDPAEQQAYAYADDGPHRRDEATLEQEDAHDAPFVHAQVAQRAHVVAFVDDEHRDAAHDVEASHQQDERQEEVGDGFLDVHDAKHLLLLFHAVEHGVVGAQRGAQALLDARFVGPLAQFELNRGDFPRLLKQLLGEGER